MANLIRWFNQLGLEDVNEVGGKNASLGEMLCNLSGLGIDVPNGFATTAEAYRLFLKENALDSVIAQKLSELDVDDVKALIETGAEIRSLIENGHFSDQLLAEITDAYNSLCEGESSLSVAVRSSATAEDLPDASFAGQQETFLNVRGLDAVLDSIKSVFASLYNDRAIAYRVHQGYHDVDIALSAGIQRMVRSETGAAGVMFSLDTESGFDQVVFITGSYGLGETVVQGAVNPDEFYVHKPTLQENRPAIVRRNLGSKTVKMVYAPETSKIPVDMVAVDPAEQRVFCLSDDEVQALAEQAVVIEKHYGRPMDIEWAKDGDNGRLYIVQARPETVKSNEAGHVLETYLLKEKGIVLASGRSIGQRIGQGTVRNVSGIDEMHVVQPGDVLVTDMTDPDWEPVMKKAAAIVTNRGGRTCHAAIIARELGIPAVVGCGDATERLKSGESVTVSCAEGDTGSIYKGLLDFKVETRDLNALPDLPFKIMMNVGNPDRAFAFQSYPNHGVGLARLEFIINRMIGVHPKALLEFSSLPLTEKRVVARRIAGYDGPKDFYIKKLAEGISSIACAFNDSPVIVRLSDFKSNEYSHLVGGGFYEPEEENPMIGFRGASRYLAESFTPCFDLECEALKYVRNEMGFTNVQIMVPFVRTLDEAKQVTELLAKNGLIRGQDGLKIIMMCEIPANAILADDFLEYFDGFSIGSNDLTQLTLGLDRDSGLVAPLFDERNAAVKALLEMAIKACKKRDKYVGICGQGPSDYPDFAKWLMDQGIDTVSLNPDSVLDTWMFLADQREG